MADACWVRVYKRFSIFTLRCPKIFRYCSYFNLLVYMHNWQPNTLIGACKFNCINVYEVRQLEHSEMFSLLRGLWDYFFRREEYYILIIGLHNAGKTVRSVFSRMYVLLCHIKSRTTSLSIITHGSTFPT